MSDRSTFRRALALAALGHALVGAWVAREPPARGVVSPGAATSAPGEIAIDLPIDEAVDQRAHPAAIAMPRATSPLAAARTPIPKLHPEPTDTGHEAAARGDEAGDAEARPHVDDGTWTGWRAAAAPIDLGLGGAARWSAGAPRDTSGSTSGGINEALAQHDRAAGIDAGGAIATTAAEITRASIAPVRGEASLDVEIDAQGHVVRVRVTRATSDARAWDDVAAAIEAALRARPLRVPPLSRGVAFAIDVASREALASGHDAEVQVAINGVTLPGSGAKKPVKLGLLIIPGFIGLGADIDPTDIAWKAQRVVTAQVVGVRRF